MPTGYTAAVQEGKVTSLNEFAMQCARAFGALITMRDDPAGAPIPEQIKPETDYYDRGLAEAHERLADLRRLTPEQAEYRALKEYEEACASHIAYQRRKSDERDRYEAMIAKVEAWRAPEEVGKLRAFMLDQLRESVRFDCGGYEMPAPERRMGAQWLAESTEEAERSIARHTKSRDEEIERAAERTRWLQALRASLPA